MVWKNAVSGASWAVMLFIPETFFREKKSKIFKNIFKFDAWDI